MMLRFVRRWRESRSSRCVLLLPAIAEREAKDYLLACRRVNREPTPLSSALLNAFSIRGKMKASSSRPRSFASSARFRCRAYSRSVAHKHQPRPKITTGSSNPRTASPNLRGQIPSILEGSNRFRIRRLFGNSAFFSPWEMNKARGHSAKATKWLRAGLRRVE